MTLQLVLALLVVLGAASWLVVRALRRARPAADPCAACTGRATKAACAPCQGCATPPR